MINDGNARKPIAESIRRARSGRLEDNDRQEIVPRFLRRVNLQKPKRRRSSKLHNLGPPTAASVAGGNSCSVMYNAQLRPFG